MSLRGHFVFKTNGRILPFTSYKDHCFSFFTSWVIKQQKAVFWKCWKNTQLWECGLHLYQGPTFHFLGIKYGSHCTPKVGCFFKIVKIQLFCCFITQLVKMLQQWSVHDFDRGYPAVRFEYKTASKRYLVAELWAKQFWVY